MEEDSHASTIADKSDTTTDLPESAKRSTEFHSRALLFKSLNKTVYLYDTATTSIHPWPWGIKGKILDQLYDLPSDKLLENGFPEDLVNYVAMWRENTGAFGNAISCDSEQNNCSGSNCQSIKPSSPHNSDISEGCESCNMGKSPCNFGASCRQKHTQVKTAPAIDHLQPSTLGNLMLVVTDACNLRCKYCLLDEYEGYKGLRKQHMDWETAKKAVDHFIELNNTPAHRSMHDRKINIAFFGGEPLLRGDLIRKVIPYAKSLQKPGCGYWIDFSMTSNLTQLPIDLAEFLAEHDVSIQVSIDGPEKLHDRYRVYANQKGSFAQITANLKLLKSLNPKYYAKRIRTIITLNGNSDLKTIRKFFDDNKSGMPIISFIGMVRDMEVSPFHEKHPYDASKLVADYSDLLSEYLTMKEDGVAIGPGEFMYHFFEEPLLNLYERVMAVNMGKRNSYTGTCPPGRRIAVATNGDFHVCERINEHHSIGNADQGLDLAACKNVLGKFYKSLPNCDHCWLGSLCTTCMAHNCDGGEFNFAHRCNHIRTEIANKLCILATLLENAPGALVSQDSLINQSRLMECPCE
ncbi:MAG: radical SAM protein [Gammaproteobacteria bacterium]|nr:radical SAM protein [Gammaproteobacteria bacterium]